jgi:putative membrane protein
MRNWIIKLFLNSIAVLLAAYFLRGGVHIASFGYAVLVALTLSVLNASIKPVLVVFTLPVTIFSLGLFLLFINTMIIKIAAYLLDPYFIVDSWWWAFFFSILLSVLNSILENMIKVPNPAVSRDNDMKIYDKDGNRIA